MNTDNMTPNELLDEEPPLFAIASDEDETVENTEDHNENHQQSVQADEGISAEEVAELRDLGLSDTEIAEILGVESIDSETLNETLADKSLDNASTNDELADKPLIDDELIVDEFTDELTNNNADDLGIFIDMDDSTIHTDDDLQIDSVVDDNDYDNDQNVIISDEDDKNSEVIKQIPPVELKAWRTLGLSDNEIVNTAGMLYINKNRENIKTEEISETVQEEIVQEEVIQEEVIQEEPLSEIDELRGLGLSDEEICHILEIDSLDADNNNNIDNFADDIIDDIADKTEAQTTDNPIIEAVDDTLIVDHENKTKSKTTTESEANKEIGGNNKLDNKHINVGKNVGKTAPALLLAYADKQFLTFPTQSLLELIESPELTALPSSKDFVYGLLHWQDKLVPVIDLALLLKERTIKTTTETSQSPQLSNELSNKKVAFVMVTAYHTAKGIAHIAVKLDKQPISMLVNNSMACELASDSDINWADYAISCFSYQNNPVPILQPEWLFV